MRTLKESLLDKTETKVGGIKSTLNPEPPKKKDWHRHGTKCWYIEYRCPNLIQNNIDKIDDTYFADKTQNPFGLKKEDLTTIRVLVLTDSKPCSTCVELCADGSGVGYGVDMLGASQYCNEFTVSTVKDKIIDFFQVVQTNPAGVENMMSWADVAYKKKLKDGYFISNYCIWNFLRDVNWSKY